MTASAFTSVSLDPVLVLVCVDKEARFRDAVLESGVWAVSMLSRARSPGRGLVRHQGPAAGRPARPVPPPSGQSPARRCSTTPLAWLECRTRRSTTAATTTSSLGCGHRRGEGDRDADALVYHRGRYGRTT